MFFKTCIHPKPKLLKTKNSKQSKWVEEQGSFTSLMPQHSFQHQFHQYSSIHSVAVVDYRIAQNDKNCHQFAVYVMKVGTEDLTFETERRYSELKQFHGKVEEKLGKKIQFPCKTFWHSGTNLQVIKKRITQLNQFFTSILQPVSKNVFLYLLSLKFLKIQEHYEKERIKLKKRDLQEPETIIDELTSINTNPESAIKYAERIQSLLLSPKKKVKTEEIRQIVLGGNGRKGIVQFCLTINNQLSQIKLLRMLNKILDPINNSLSETVTKFFLMLPTSTLKINEKNLQIVELRNSYFQLIKTYCEKGELQVEDILSPNYYEKYEEWVKKMEKLKKDELYRNRSRVLIESPKEIRSKQKRKNENKMKVMETQILQFQKETLGSSEMEFKVLKQVKKDDFSLLQMVNKNSNLLKFQLTCKGDFYHFMSSLMNESWNPLICSSRTDQFTNFLKQTVKFGTKQQKTLLFKVESINRCERKISTETTDSLIEEEQYEKSKFCLIKRPPKMGVEKSYDSYYQKVGMEKREGNIVIKIWMYFQEQNMRNYVKSELEGKSNIILDGIVKQFSSI